VEGALLQVEDRRKAFIEETKIFEEQTVVVGR